MSIIGWIVVGLAAGFIASRIAHKRGRDIVPGVILGIGGAILGGIAFTKLGAAGATEFNIYSMLVAVIGSVIVLLIYHVLVVPGHHPTS